MVSTRGTDSKRAAEDTTAKSPPATKRAKIDDGEKEKNQKTIEETMKGAEDSMEDDATIAKELNAEDNSGTANGDVIKESGGKGEQEEKTEATSDESKTKESDGKPEDEETKKSETKEKSGHIVVEDSKREEAMPSSILEKGIIYFFFRGRVNIDEPHSVDDIARSYMVLRPLPIGAKIGDGTLEDSGNARLLALPKKVLPKSHRDRFLVFVEKANATIKDLKEDFMKGSDYATQTAG